MNDINTLFFELIQVALGMRICLSHTPTADELGELYAMAMKQSLGRRLLCLGAAVATATTRISRDAVSDLDGDGCKDSAAE